MGGGGSLSLNNFQSCDIPSDPVAQAFGLGCDQFVHSLLIGIPFTRETFGILPKEFPRNTFHGFSANLSQLQQPFCGTGNQRVALNINFAENRF